MKYISLDLLFEKLNHKLDWECVGIINELPTVDIDTEETDIVEVETNLFDKCITITNCTIEILENTITHEISVGWYKTEDSEEITNEADNS